MKKLALFAMLLASGSFVGCEPPKKAPAPPAAETPAEAPATETPADAKPAEGAAPATEAAPAAPAEAPKEDMPPK